MPKNALGRVVEIRSEPGGAEAVIACPAGAIPAPGQYTLAAAAGDVLGTALFLAKSREDGFQAAQPLPAGWEPGTQLALRGPLGHGFRLPDSLQRLALVACGESITRLLPLASAALARQVAVTLFSDLRLPALPAALEAFPLEALREALAWADFLAMDVPIEDLDKLGDRLGLAAGGKSLYPGQALVQTPMPCAGLAECGACAVKTRRGWKLACEDGPGFDLKAILSKS